MISDLAKDRFITHGITNYLLASFQGKFAFLNLLAQHQHPAFSADELAKTQSSLAKVSAWSEQLFKDECLFSASWTTAETFESQAALDLLTQLKPELYNLASELGRILTLPQIPQVEEIIWLVAIYARHAYSRDAYIRGFYEYADRFSLADMKGKYAPALEECELETRRSSELIGGLKAKETLTQPTNPFLPLLFQSTVALGATFRCHIHDINLLLAQFKGGLTFHTAEFTKAEADLWKDSGFGPAQAGYWRAYAIGSEEAKGWVEKTIPDAATAVEWKKGSFTASTAWPWIERRFPPPLAFIWARAGYSAEKAEELIKKGHQMPPQKDEA